MIEGLLLVHPEKAMCDVFRHRFAGLRGVRIIQGRFEDMEPHDVFVRAGHTVYRLISWDFRGAVAA